MDSQNFDVIILGAGVSGLLIASELSKEHHVLIVEKEDNLPTNKYWLTNRKCAAGSDELLDCVDSEYHHIDFCSYDGERYRCRGDYLLWDTDRLMAKLQKSIVENSGLLLYGHTFYSYGYAKRTITVIANEKKFASKLLIDCMGYASPIIYAKGLVDIAGYYMVYGKVLNLKRTIDPIGLSNIVLSSKPRYLEVFPKQNGHAYVVLIQPEGALKYSSSLATEFKFIVEKSEYSSYFETGDLKENHHLWGLVPVGKLRTNSLERIFLFGEAGQMNPGATATCFTQLLYSYKDISFELSKRIRSDDLSSHNLSINNPHFSARNRSFHLHLFNNILNWGSDDFRKLVLHMKDMDNQLINDIIFGEISIHSLLNSKSILGLIKSRNYFVLKPLLQSLF